VLALVEMSKARAKGAKGVKGGSAIQAAQTAEAQAAAHRETPAQKRSRISELQERARLFGDPVKQSSQAKVLERKWQRFLLVHGEEYGFDERKGPTIGLVEKFSTYCFCTRDRVSAIGREGLGDSFELQLRYMLAKFVFVSLKYSGWTGLSAHELHKKAEPYKFAVQEQWKRLKTSDPDLLSSLKPFVKSKWCDTAYFQAQVRVPVGRAACARVFLKFVVARAPQDHNMTLFETAKMHLVLFVTRMTVMGFVRATCSRGGSVCKDWFDRVGQMVYWLTRNVLSVGDFVWAKEGTDGMLKRGECDAAPQCLLCVAAAWGGPRTRTGQRRGTAMCCARERLAGQRHSALSTTQAWSWSCRMGRRRRIHCAARSSSIESSITTTRRGMSTPCQLRRMPCRRRGGRAAGSFATSFAVACSRFSTRA